MGSPKLIIFTAPSGAGKTTIVKHLLKVREDLAFSISACTRSQRYGEVNGLDYYFLSVEEFKRKVSAGDFVEYEEVYENQFYGTLKAEIERLKSLGKNVIFDIDVKGAVNIKKFYGDEALTVFVSPPSPEVLFERLKSRKTEDEESLRKRIARARIELGYENKFDVTLINNDLETALNDAEMIVNTFLSEGVGGLKKNRYGNFNHQ
jgi:guanylate kinase